MEIYGCLNQATNSSKSTEIGMVFIYFCERVGVVWSHQILIC